MDRTSMDEERRAATLHDVAGEVGVHPSTVSRALDPLKREMVKASTRRRIEEAAERLGYRPHMVARGLQSGRTATVGVITADLGNTWVTPILHGIAGSLEQAAMMPVIADTQDDDTRFSNILDHMLSRRVDAIVTLAARDGHRERLESAARVVPVVVAARPLEGTELPQVIQDDYHGAELVATHLHGLGHRKVLQLSGPRDVVNFRRRADGFSSVCRSLGVTELTTGLHADRPILEEGQRLMSALLASRVEMPTAIFAHNDLMAVGALSVLREAGLRVPEDVSLAGYNDLPMVGDLTPPLTTVRFPSLELGIAVGRLTSELLSGHEVEDVCLAPELQARASTAPPA